MRRMRIRDKKWLGGIVQKFIILFGSKWASCKRLRQRIKGLRFRAYGRFLCVGFYFRGC